MPRYAIRSAAVALVLAIAACAGDSTGPKNGKVPTRIQALAGNGQQGPVATTLRDSVVIQVLDQSGAGLGGVMVRHNVTAGGGTVSPTSGTTDANGVSRFAWTLGPQEGAQSVTVSVERQGVAPLVVAAQAQRRVVNAAPGLTLISGSGQVLPAGCAAPVVLEARDADGGPLAGARVNFTVQGNGRVSVPEAVTGTDGRVEVKLTVGPGDNSLVAALDDNSAAAATARAEGKPVAPGGYATVGNQIVSSVTCQPHRFAGLSRSGLEWYHAEYRLSDDTAAAADFARIRSWNANVVRIPLNQTFYVKGTREYNEGYPELVDRLVRQARAAGLDVILDLHASDRGDPDYAGKKEIQQMPDVNHSIPFWRGLAAKYKNDGRVIFELYNEPNGVSWDIWLNGGTVPGGAAFPNDPYASFKKEYQAVGMQALYKAVRDEGADNLVIVAGTHWGYYLNEVPKYRVQGYNIAYAAHPYDYPDKRNVEQWERDWAPLAATDPVIVSEFGAYDCRPDFFRKVLDYVDQRKLSWVAWSYWTPPADQADREKELCTFPALITDWSGTTTAAGQVVKDRLASYR